MPWIVLAASLLICWGVWRWAERIFLPANLEQAQASARPVGNNSDLYPRWLGTREALLRGRDPYSAQVTREIQIGFYGRPVNPDSPSDPKAEEGFIYPLYVAFLLAPMATLPFRTVQEIFRWLLLAAIAGSVPLWIDAFGFRPRSWLVFAGVVLALSSYPAVLEFHMQNLAALVVFFLAAAAALLAHKWLVLTGFLLAWATVKPEISWLVILSFLIWTMGCWKERQRLVWSFSGTLLGLLLAAEMISPHWITGFLGAVRTYSGRGGDPNILHVLLPSWTAVWAAALLLFVDLYICWHARKAASSSTEFGWAIAWAATTTLVLVPKLAAYNQLLLIPALLILIADHEKTRKAGFPARVLVKGAFSCLLWLWLSALVLSLCSLGIPALRFRALAQWPVKTFLALPPLTLLAVIASTLTSKGLRQSFSVRASENPV